MDPEMSSSECHRLEPRLSGFVDGQLDTAQAAEVREHLAGCQRCVREVQALEALGVRLAVLKTAPVASGALPSAAAGLRALPTWLVWVALLRRWAVAAGVVAVCWLGVLLLNRWTQPLPATVTAQATTHNVPQLTAGTTLLAKPGETVTLHIPELKGTLILRGPGSLIVKGASLGRLRQDPRMSLELPAGSLSIQIPPKAATHLIQLQTPQALVHLSGTWVLVNTNPLRTELAVLEGEVALQSVADRARRRLGAGETAQVEAGWVRIGRLPTALWLQLKGIARSGSGGADEADSAPGPSGLWHEEDGS